MNVLPDHCDPLLRFGIILFSRDANPLTPHTNMALLSFHSQNMVGTGYYLKYGCSFYVPFYGFVIFFCSF